MSNELIIKDELKALEESKCTLELVTSPEFSEAYAKMTSLVNYLSELKKTVDSNIKELVKEQFLETGENVVASQGFRYTYVPGTTRETFDSKRFKKENPDAYKNYVTVSSVSESVRITKIGEEVK